MSEKNNQKLIELMERLGWRFEYGEPEDYFVYSTARMTEKVAQKILKEVEKAYDEGFNACINEQCDQEKLKKQYENEIKKAELRAKILALDALLVYGNDDVALLNKAVSSKSIFSLTKKYQKQLQALEQEGN